QGILCGTSADIIECDFGRIVCAICFDLNFDSLRSHYASLRPDLIVFSSMYHGGLAQQLWAYACRSYFVGAIAGPTVPSEIRNPFGEVISTSTNYLNYTVADINLDYCLAHLDLNWLKLDELKKRYGSDVTIYDPGRIGSVLIQSNSEEMSARDMAREFDVLLLDDYFRQCLEFHGRPENREPSA
ncbi:MAG TPA: carbon-nitrogen hydrolase family protein, partial [Spirochaetia bacterium]|nr:carbon-nitrogen hydrolase family protein [Spirochaetia bacterium]